MSTSQIELVKVLLDDYCKSSWASDPWRSASFSSLPDAVRAASITDSSYRLFSSVRFVQYLSAFLPASSLPPSSEVPPSTTLTDDQPAPSNPPSSSSTNPTASSTASTAPAPAPALPSSTTATSTLDDGEERIEARQLGEQLYRMLEDPSHFCVDKVTDILLTFFDRKTLSCTTWIFDVFAQPQFSIYNVAWTPFCLVLENVLDNSADLSTCGRIIRRILSEVQSLLDFNTTELTPDNPCLFHSDPSIPLSQAGARVLAKLADLIPMYFWFTEASRLFESAPDDHHHQNHTSSSTSAQPQSHPTALPQPTLTPSPSVSASASASSHLQLHHTATGQHKPIVLHWSLQELFDNIFGHRYRLSQFLRGIGTTECIGPEIQARQKETDLMRIIQSGVSTLNGASRQNLIAKLHLMFKLSMSTEMLENEVFAYTNNRNSVSEELCAAMSLQTRDLLRWTEKQLAAVPRPHIRDIWAPWYIFSTQFYEMLRCNMIDLICYLQLVIQIHRKESLRMDIVIWMVCNCSPATLPLLCHELALGGDTLSQIMFACRTSDDPIGYRVADMARTLLFYRIIAETDAADQSLKQNLVKFFDPAWVDERQRRIYRESKQRFDADHLHFDFSNLSEMQEDLLMHIASYFPSLPAVLIKIQVWLRSPAPGRKPIPTSLLNRLTPIMRERIFAMLLEDVCNHTVPFAVIETLARLSYFLPRERARIESRLKKHATPGEDKKDSVVHTFVELINYRLFRLWQSRNACPNLLNTLLAYQLLRTSNPFYYENVVSLLWRIFLASSRLRFQAAAIVSCPMSLATMRVFLYGIARNMQTQDVQDAGHLAKLRPLLHELTTKSIRPPAQSQRVSFPNELDVLLPRTESWPRQRPPTIELFGNQEVCPALELFSGKENALLPVMWTRMINRRDVQTLKAAFQQFSPQRRADLSYLFVDWLVDAQDLEARFEPQVFLNLSGEAHLSVSSMIVALLDRADEDEHQVIVFKVLDVLVNTLVFHENLRLAQPEHWRDESFHFNLGSQIIGSHGQYHAYYTLPGLRALPLLDYMLCRCIELLLDGRQPATTLLEKFKSMFKEVYAFHSTPVGFIRDTLSYYCRRLAESRNIHFAVVNLLMHLFPTVFAPNLPHFSAQFSSYVSDPEASGTALPSDYYRSLVEKIAVQLRGNQQPDEVAFDFQFREFPCRIDEVRVQVVIELLTLPIHQSNITVDLIWVALSQLSTERTAFAPLDVSVLNAVALILAALPQSFHNHLIELGNNILTSPQKGLSRATDTTPLLQSMYGTDFESTRASSFDTIPGLFLLILQSVLSFGRVHSIGLIPDLLLRPIFEETTSDFFSINRLFFLCKLISPFICRVQLDLLIKFLDFFFAYLLRIDDYVEELVTVVHPHKAAFALQLLDTVIHFIFHCRLAFTGFPPEFLANIGKIIAQFSPYLSKKFRFWN